MYRLRLGIKSYLVDSNNNEVANPKYYRTQKRKLRKASKKLSRAVKGSSNRVKAKIKLARVHERITNLRDDFAQAINQDSPREYYLYREFASSQHD